MADDKELNKWCSLKRALEYKPDHKELNDVKMYRQKAANEGLKKKILKSLYRYVHNPYIVSSFAKVVCTCYA